MKVRKLKKLFLLLFLGSVGLLGLGTSMAFGRDAIPFSRTIYVVNASDNLSDAGVVNDLSIFQMAANEDFAPYWNTAPVMLVLQDDVNQIPQGSWVMYLRDGPDCLFCAGYHAARGSPYAVIGTEAGLNWQIVFSHELFEMLADPYVNEWVNTSYCVPFAGCLVKEFYNLEVCDPVPSFGYGYWKDGIRISDFVTPAWFAGRGGVKLDYTGFLTHALRVARHGYLGTFTPNSRIIFK